MQNSAMLWDSTPFEMPLLHLLKSTLTHCFGNQLYSVGPGLLGTTLNFSPWRQKVSAPTLGAIALQDSSADEVGLWISEARSNPSGSYIELGSAKTLANNAITHYFHP
eukprot:3284015-Amphidinium_carterae.1